MIAHAFRSAPLLAAMMKFFDFVEQLGLGKHDFSAAGHVLKIYLTDNTPLQTHSVKADLAEFAGGTGYTAGGADVANEWTESNGVATLQGQKVTWVAGAADWNPFRYVVLYNDTQASPVDPLVGAWDWGASLTLAVGESFVVKFNNSDGLGNILSLQ